MHAVGENEWINRVEESIKRNEIVSRKHAHSTFVGPPGSGKSSLMAKLLQKERKGFSKSTGVSEPVVTVTIDTENPSTFHSAIVSDSNTWKEEEYDTSLVRQLGDGGSASLPSELDIQMQPPEAEIPTKSFPNTGAFISMPPAEEHPPEAAAVSRIKLSDSNIREMISMVVRRNGGYKEFKKFLSNNVSLYLQDTGGQVEFQEMVSLAVSGPSIFFFVFRMDADFQSKFSIEYRASASASESTNCYTSSITIEEAFLQCLASVYAMNAPCEGTVKTHDPLVFIVGTHKDKLGSAADEKIADLNKHLHSLIAKSDFQDLVQYANVKKNQVMFTVDNTSESDKDFKLIRSEVNSLITSRDEFTVEYPMSYLLFCLELQSLNRSVLSLEECKAMAANYGIVDEQVSHLLKFLYLRIGVIQYFDVEGLRHIVVKEPQVLFKKVTNLIVKTFSCKSLRTRQHQDFRKGIVTASLLKSVVDNEKEITCKDFLELLVHLRIMTPFPSTSKEKRYFIPCVLNYVQESSEEDPPTDILPLCVSFKCKHVPKGLFGVLVTHLMTLESEREADTSFILMENKIYKDQVSFQVHSDAEVNEVSLKMFPSHLKVNFFPSYEDEESSCWVKCACVRSWRRPSSDLLLLGEVCSTVHQILKTSILRSLDALHYKRCSVQPMMCLRCQHCPDLHPVKKGKIYCEQKKKNYHIPTQGSYWFYEGK